MVRLNGIAIPQQTIDRFCRQHNVRKLSFFGSILRDDFRPDSDIDVLVEFQPDTRVGLRLFAMERELSDLLGRKVDLHTPGFLGKYFRDQVMAEAVVQYGATNPLSSAGIFQSRARQVAVWSRLRKPLPHGRGSDQTDRYD